MEQIIETNFNSQAAKYKDVPNFVEPNLTKRIEAKREKARLRAMVNASEQYSDMSSMISLSDTQKMYQSVGCGIKLERVNEETEEHLNSSFKLAGGEGRPMTIQSIQSQSNVIQQVATPTPKLNDQSKLTKQDTQRVLGRQFTMQLMPMYRVR